MVGNLDLAGKIFGWIPWLYDRLSRPRIRVTVNDTKWHGSHPYRQADDVLSIQIYLAFDNHSGVLGGVSSLRLEIKGHQPFFPKEQLSREEVVEFRKYNPAVRGPTGTWLRLPLRLERWGSESGWVEFKVSEDLRKLTFEEARNATGHVVATVTGKGEIRAPIRACPYPIPDAA